MDRGKGFECFHDDKWPTKPKVCREATVEYPDEDSPVAMYRIHDNDGSTNETDTTKSGHHKRRHGRDLICLTDEKHGVFTVREPGVYLVHLNITVVDESHNHSLAIFLNGQAVLACPKGGFRCPHSNEPRSHKYRICNIDGVLEMNKGDTLQVRTLEPKTMIRLEGHRKSQLRFILLHPMGKEAKKGKKRKPEG
ncbi:unnamed protein product [Lymnaea stagnalis]|uniref:Uncharacterized protein n=1 Tax=Lymnaea stagnalis TaxID=6523 RepID=A0AAV2H966_LYMST